MLLVIVFSISWFLLFLIILNTSTNARLYICSLDSGVIAALLFVITYLCIKAFASKSLASTSAPIVPMVTSLMASIIIWRAKRSANRLYIRFLSTDMNAANREIEKISKWEQEEYNEQTINAEGLKSWHQAYPLGGLIFCDRQDTNVIGVMSFWPITKDCFEKLKHCIIDERNITSQLINPSPNPIEMTHWYIGDVFLKKKFRGQGMGGKMIMDAFKVWYEHFKPNGPVTFCATAASKIGLAMLQRSGFECHLCNLCLS
ncbi:MAG: hypothetical protein P8X55_00865, partial [Desulfosarcinaceae bacterium]